MVSSDGLSSGSWTNERSSSPRSTRSASTLSECDSRSSMSTFGHARANRRITSGRILAPTLWKMPTWSEPASPAERAARSDCAACSRETIARAWRSSSRPASVSATGLGPPGRSTSFSPTMRSRVAICWLTADWV